MYLLKGTGASENIFSKSYTKVPSNYVVQKIDADIPNSYAHSRISNNIVNFVTFKKSKKTSPLIGMKQQD